MIHMEPRHWKMVQDILALHAGFVGSCAVVQRNGAAAGVNSRDLVTVCVRDCVCGGL